MPGGYFAARRVHHILHARQRRIFALRNKHYTVTVRGEMTHKVQILAGKVLMNTEHIHDALCSKWPLEVAE